MKNQHEIKLPLSLDWVDEVKDKARQNMKKYDSCSQSILAAFLDIMEIDEPILIRSAGAMHGGMVSSLTCGIHSSAMMLLGVLLGRENIEDGIDGLMPVVAPAQKLIQRLNGVLGSHSCREITGVDFTNRRQALEYHRNGGKLRCEELVMRGAEEIARFLIKAAERGELYHPKTQKKQALEEQ